MGYIVHNIIRRFYLFLEFVLLTLPPQGRNFMPSQPCQSKT
jgi:hypothetical protein